MREGLRVSSSPVVLGGRLLHPSRGQRIGEAATPGPPGRSADTPMDTTSGTPGLRRDTPPSNPADPTLAWPLENDVYILKPNGRDIRLTCGWLPKFRSWRWSCGSGANRWQHQSCLSPAEALRGWLARHPHHLNGTEIRPIEAALARATPPTGPPLPLLHAFLPRLALGVFQAHPALRRRLLRRHFNLTACIRRRLPLLPF